MLGRLSGYVLPVLEITILDRDEATVSFRDKSLTMRTVVYVSDSDQPRVLAIGEESVPDQPHRRIELFRGGKPLYAHKEGYLRVYFQYAFRHVLGFRSHLGFLRVVFYGADCLEPCLCGYHEGLLRDVALSLGATLKVEFRS